MRLFILRCGERAANVPLPAAPAAAVVSEHQLTDVPSRQELKLIDAAAADILPVDPTPSLDEISAAPEVAHLGAPGPAPQPVPEPLRVIVVGSDPALAAVLTRAMRADYLWVEFGFVPLGDSPAAANWGLPTADPAAAFRLAAFGRVNPAPVIRTDTGKVVAGSAVLTQAGGHQYTGEIVVDNETIIAGLQAGGPDAMFGEYGARLVPMTDAPGILAAPLSTPWLADPAWPRGSRLGRAIAARTDPVALRQLWESPGGRRLLRGVPRPHGVVDTGRLAIGRAVQSAGEDILVTVDGVAGPRPVKRVTFYRHLRDLQVVRP